MFYNMYFIQYFHYKSVGYVWRGIKKISRPQKLYSAPWFFNSWILHWYQYIVTFDIKIN